MSSFPQLKTGAVMQYPARRESSFATRVLRFIDGKEQRFRERGAGRQRWMVRLDLLDDDEMVRLEEFFAAMQGTAGSFAFTDPWSGQQYASCSFEGDEAAFGWVGDERGHTMLIVQENKS